MGAGAMEWISMLVRWAHIITGIAWIGSSFYFIWLDLSLRKYGPVPEGVQGENWSVHGGGFYHSRKYTVAPAEMPEELHWFKWESYMTWVSGFSLLVITYYFGAESYLIDREVMELEVWQAIAISILALAGTWVFYDMLCRSPLKDYQYTMFFVLFIAIVAATWGLGQLLSARATFLHVGAMIATIMSANVVMVIIPNQKIVVADLLAGRTPDAKYGRIAKLRSTHNNYLTLPVLFMMISNHYPMTYSHEMNWIIVGIVLMMGFVIRHYYNSKHAGKTGEAVSWQWPVAGILATAMIVFGDSNLGKEEFVIEKQITTAQAFEIIQTRCAYCHAAVPDNEELTTPPKGIRLEIPQDIKRHADLILKQAVITKAMPLNNLTGMTGLERAQLANWIDADMPDE